MAGSAVPGSDGLAAVSGVALGVVTLSLVVAFTVLRPLTRLAATVVAVAEGRAPLEIPYSDRRGPVGTVARAIRRFKESIAERDAAIRKLRYSDDRLRAALDDVQRADALKAHFLASASHDLRQPVQALRLFLDVLDGRLEKPADRAVLAQAHRALAGAEELLASYLDVSTLEAGIVRPQPVALAVATVLDELAGEFGPRASDKGLRFDMVGCSAAVESDPLLFARLLRHLLANAVRYTKSGRILLGCRRRGRMLHIQVCDTGIGIPADKLAAVFDDFVQLGNAERDRAKGLGLGLSVVTRTARLLGHQVGVASRPGRGSMFWVEVPMAEPPPTVEHRTAA